MSTRLATALAVLVLAPVRGIPGGRASAAAHGGGPGHRGAAAVAARYSTSAVRRHSGGGRHVRAGREASVDGGAAPDFHEIRPKQIRISRR